ncbi:hypothetical protein CDAR_283431 [Caerostris darwini]|uniref:Uncharacterized protein n=1 Tax=Caerostris darwini TaxID=1538125 RepID=A0AAV4WNN6_9ARAC|nr:hypothetical protein CDAR_283431 [Caerostris darwini]
MSQFTTGQEPKSLTWSSMKSTLLLVRRTMFSIRWRTTGSAWMSGSFRYVRCRERALSAAAFSLAICCMRLQICSDDCRLSGSSGVKGP